MESEQNTLEMFIERLLDEKQFKDLEPEVRDQLKKDLTGRATDHMNAALLTELSSEQLNEFEKMMDEGKSEKEIRAFLATHIKEMDQVVAASLIRFRNSYLGNQ